jgi:hypothetical protein
MVIADILPVLVQKLTGSSNGIGGQVLVDHLEEIVAAPVAASHCWLAQSSTVRVNQVAFNTDETSTPITEPVSKQYTDRSADTMANDDHLVPNMVSHELVEKLGTSEDRIGFALVVPP